MTLLTAVGSVRTAVTAVSQNPKSSFLALGECVIFIDKRIHTFGVFGPFLTDFLADCGPFEVIFWATTGETGTGAVLEPPRTRPAQPLLNKSSNS